jgi:ParB family chromosome partitioning protein
MPNTTPQNQNKKTTQRLGRGIDSLFGGAASSVSELSQGGSVNAQPSTEKPYAPRAPIDEAAKIWKISIDKLKPNTQQPRQVFSAEALKDLSASIKEQGILQPITARRLNESEFEIIAGERRWRAAQMAGLHEVPVILRISDNKNSLELAIIENIQRENLNAMEEAEAYDFLLSEYDLTQQEVAQRLGKDRSSVANSLRFLALAPDVKALLRGGEISPGHAKVLLSIEDGPQQLELAQQIVKQRLSVRATEKLISNAKKQKGRTKTSDALNVDVSQRLIEGLAAELQKLMGTKVNIDYANSKGKLSIHFYSDDQLTQIVEQMRSSWEK